MHGLIFSQLQRYVDTNLGDGTWSALLDAAGKGGNVYLPVREYPDAELVDIVATAADVCQVPPDALLEDFGCFIVPGLVQTYGSLIRPEWRTLDLIENTEEAIHTAVRLRNPGARPPQLVVHRPSRDEVVVDYSSARRLCSVAKGIIRGVADHYGDPVHIAESACMHWGGASCHISVRAA